ncbi:HAUS augmin-like complex subunit 3 isoform X1 [Haliotis rufescens]|uniref:HAUS augmin-like complex subunit 3 isoform X1 n=1 Tax=Haliotis rufescens TaxID=6454 RepID=UPI00201FABCD|nr:HAUS augmin-like complex subunit 3 isoform X1 [Haliotis rufescens]XP_048255739.1 HAUS augmin-like complex subunit 3 isoform X1 [Haliotis rufescens]XP_048255741.1 HAUS augmin-like complex subunit 3 isoform X1 [Haliotis rufescens]XP_048255742.1 HAUS augmin-like complex subunit 3 isoform X1 [Haliotis rufescens]
MSGRQFLETLKQLDYPNADSLDPQMFNWMFENETVSAFLQWFCASVSSSNVLLPVELQQFAELERSNEGVLEGNVLEDALKTFSTSTKNKETVESLRERVSILHEDLDEDKRKKQQLVHRRDRLNAHLTGLGHRLSQLTVLESQAKRDCQKAMEQLDTDNNEVNESLDGLVRSVMKIHSLYDLPVESRQEASHPATFLSHVKLGDYHDMEDKFSHELKLFTKKRFFDGVAEMAGQNEGTKYELLEVSNPECLMVRGEKQDIIVQDSQELARLKAVYPISQSQLIEASASEKQMSATVSHTQKIIQRLQSGEFPVDLNKLRDSLQESHMSLNAVRRDLTQLQQTDIPALISRSADLQGTNIITGDYKLKLARQGYFTSNQDQLIDQLVVQRARNEFLTMAYEIESRNHRDIHRLLTAVRRTLEQNLTDWRERQKAMEDPCITPARHQRGTIDSRDKATTRLHQMLTGCESGEQQLFLTKAGMVDGAQQLQHKHTAADSALAAAIDKHQHKTRLLEGEMRVCVDQLYHGSSTTSGEPTVTPPLLQETLTNLDTMLVKLEASIIDVIKDHDTKKKLLKSNLLQAKERDLFTYFFSRPGQLRETFESIKERLQAQTVH